MKVNVPNHLNKFHAVDNSNLKELKNDVIYLQLINQMYFVHTCKLRL